MENNDIAMFFLDCYALLIVFTLIEYYSILYYISINKPSEANGKHVFVSKLLIILYFTFCILHFAFYILHFSV